KSGSVVMSNDGGKHLTVFDSSSKTYYQLPMAELLSGAADAITSNPMLRVTFGQPKVSTRDGGDGGKLEGYPTRKTVVDASIDLQIDAPGQTGMTTLTAHRERSAA